MKKNELLEAIAHIGDDDEVKVYVDLSNEMFDIRDVGVQGGTHVIYVEPDEGE
jgi:hypothetical protein